MAKKNSKILITGSSGFIGTHLVNHLLPRNTIIGISNTKEKKRLSYIPIKKDINKLVVQDIPGNVTGIIHLAALSDINYCNKNPSECYETNVLGTQKILEIARKKKCKLIFLSSSHVYGPPEKIPIKEDHPTNPYSIYSSSKLSAECLCSGYAKCYGLDISVIRLFSVYGPNSPSHLVTSKIISQLENRVIKLGNLQSKRDFIYVKDVVKAVEVILHKSRNFNIYNVGYGKSYSILELCDTLKKLSKTNASVKTIQKFKQKNDVKEIVSDISKIKKLGWKPAIPFTIGLKMTLKSFSKKYHNIR